jgi:hypothetical protein
MISESYSELDIDCINFMSAIFGARVNKTDRLVVDSDGFWMMTNA